MDSRKPLYRHSLKEAVRHEEKDLWRESYKINCDCAMAIERIIAENYDGKKLGPDLAEPIIEQYGFNRVNWVLANTVQQKKGRWPHLPGKPAMGRNLPDSPGGS